jgi:3'-5' exoribonuclease
MRPVPDRTPSPLAAALARAGVAPPGGPASVAAPSVAGLPDHHGPTVAALRAGDDVEAVYACTRKDRLLARSGSPYLALELRDRTGAIPGRAFRDADVLGGRFERGDLVRVRARVERFRDELQLDVRAIARAPEADPAAFLPVAYRDLDELEGFLEHLAREVHDPELAALLAALLGDGELRAAWRRAPCTRAGHHAYLGGLLEHTVAVGTLALEAAQLHPRLDRDLLLTAALVHDLGKTREFAYGAEIGLSEEGRLLGHLVLGQQLLDARAAGLVSAERRLAMLHCVLTHHGPEAAPGRRFGSPEALALHRLNALDASVKGALEHGLPG